MVQTGMTAPYAAQFAQNGEAGGPMKAAEAGKEASVVPGPPFSPPAAVPLNGIEQQTVSIVSIQYSVDFMFTTVQAVGSV